MCQLCKHLNFCILYFISIEILGLTYLPTCISHHRQYLYVKFYSSQRLSLFQRRKLLSLQDHILKNKIAFRKPRTCNGTSSGKLTTTRMTVQGPYTRDGETVRSKCDGQLEMSIAKRKHLDTEYLLSIVRMVCILYLSQNPIFTAVIKIQTLIFPNVIKRQNPIFPTAIKRQNPIFHAVIKRNNPIFPTAIKRQNPIFPVLIKKTKPDISPFHKNTNFESNRLLWPHFPSMINFYELSKKFPATVLVLRIIIINFCL